MLTYASDCDYIPPQKIADTGVETNSSSFDVAFVAWILGMAWLGLHSWRSGACMRSPSLLW